MHYNRVYNNEGIGHYLTGIYGEKLFLATGKHTQNLYILKELAHNPTLSVPPKPLVLERRFGPPYCSMAPKAGPPLGPTVELVGSASADCRLSIVGCKKY